MYVVEDNWWFLTWFVALFQGQWPSHYQMSKWAQTWSHSFRRTCSSSRRSMTLLGKDHAENASSTSFSQHMETYQKLIGQQNQQCMPQQHNILYSPWHNIQSVALQHSSDALLGFLDWLELEQRQMKQYTMAMWQQLFHLEPHCFMSERSHGSR